LCLPVATRSRLRRLAQPIRAAGWPAEFASRTTAGERAARGNNGGWSRARVPGQMQYDREGIKSTNQRHSTQDHVEVASSPTRAFASAAKHVKSLVRNGTRCRTMDHMVGKFLRQHRPPRRVDMAIRHVSRARSTKETRLRDRWVCPIRNRTCPP
jgi:hypothetical protein